jgi:hypothetical protein
MQLILELVEFGVQGIIGHVTKFHTKTDAVPKNNQVKAEHHN